MARVEEIQFFWISPPRPFFRAPKQHWEAVFGACNGAVSPIGFLNRAARCDNDPFWSPFLCKSSATSSTLFFCLFPLYFNRVAFCSLVDTWDFTVQMPGLRVNNSMLTKSFCANCLQHLQLCVCFHSIFAVSLFAPRWTSGPHKCLDLVSSTNSAAALDPAGCLPLIIRVLVGASLAAATPSLANTIASAKAKLCAIPHQRLAATATLCAISLQQSNLYTQCVWFLILASIPTLFDPPLFSYLCGLLGRAFYVLTAAILGFSNNNIPGKDVHKSHDGCRSGPWLSSPHCGGRISSLSNTIWSSHHRFRRRATALRVPREVSALSGLYHMDQVGRCVYIPPAACII